MAADGSHGRLGDKQVEAKEIANASSFYDQLETKAAVALVRHLRRDPDYLNAIRLLDQPAGDSSLPLDHRGV